MKALVEQVKDVGVLSDPAKLLGLADAVTRAITPDSELDSVEELTGFARGLSGIGAGNVHMITLPVAYDRIDPNRVVPWRSSPGRSGRPSRTTRPSPPPPRRTPPPGRPTASWDSPGIPPARPRFGEMRPVLADWYVGPGSRMPQPAVAPEPSRNIGDTLKREIHPEYVETQVSCTCGASFTTRSTLTDGTIRAEVCSSATRSTRASRRSSTPAAASPASRPASARPPAPPASSEPLRRSTVAPRGWPGPALASP